MGMRGGKRRLNLSARVLIGLGLGVLTGLFAGEHVAFLEIVGNIFIRLLQMSVLPYVTVSLITGLGGLDYDAVGKIARTCGTVMLLLWAIALGAVSLMPLAFPTWESASFFSTSLVAENASVDFVDLYVPSNPFHALSNAIVPAVVLFSIAVGVALIGVPQKRSLLDTLNAMQAALSRVTMFVVGLAPYGVFAIAASAAGTMQFEEFGRIQVYVAAFISMALLLTFWVFPGLVAAVTPLRYRDVLAPARDGLITAFATGSLFVVIPILVEKGKLLLEQCADDREEAETALEVVIPTSYSFPSSGTLLVLGFILFAGWFTGAVVPAAAYPRFLLTGLFSMFAGSTMSMPFLLDQMQIPADMFHLFIIIEQIFHVRFGTLLAAMHCLVLGVLGGAAVAGVVRIHWRHLARYIFISLMLLAVAIAGNRLCFETTLEREYDQDKVLVAMHLPRVSAPARLYRDQLPAPLAHDPSRSRMGEIGERGFMRVGYTKDSLPFAFVNAAGQLVGLDIELAHHLADELGVTLEFVLIERGKIAERLREGYCDIVMSGLAITTDRMLGLDFTAPHQEQTLALVVLDHRRGEFAAWSRVADRQDLTIAVPGSHYYLERMSEWLPGAELILLESPREFFRHRHEDVDALVFTAEAGAAWSMIYPRFSVAVPRPVQLKVPLAFAIAEGDTEMLGFLNSWITLKRLDGTIQGAFDYWILGKQAVPEKPRWSVVRNVLHWVD